MDTYECPLCKPVKDSHYECDTFRVQDCPICNFPIIVFTEHMKEVDEDLINEALRACENEFDMSVCKVDAEYGCFPLHKNLHLIPKDELDVDFKEEDEEEDLEKELEEDIKIEE